MFFTFNYLLAILLWIAQCRSTIDTFIESNPVTKIIVHDIQYIIKKMSIGTLVFMQRNIHLKKMHLLEKLFFAPF